jgi:hypothetical protein
MEALNIPLYIPSYEFFNSKIIENYPFNPEGSAFINDILKTNKYQMLHIFGDTDGACSLYGTRKWFKALGWKVTKSWAPYTV